MKTQTHTLLITVRFDKKCTARVARRNVKDCIHGDFYPTAYEDDEPDKFKVTSIRPGPRK